MHTFICCQLSKACICLTPGHYSTVAYTVLIQGFCNQGVVGSSTMKVNLPIMHSEHAWYGCLTWRIPGVIVQEEKTTTIRPDGLILAIVHVRIKQIHQTLPFCKHSLVGKLGKHSYLLLHMPESDLIQSGKERGIKNITMHTCHWSHNVFFKHMHPSWHMASFI